MNNILERIEKNNPSQPEFIQAVSEIYQSVAPVLEQKPEWVDARIFERMFDPERTISFCVNWIDDAGNVQINRFWDIIMSSAIGVPKGGDRSHPSVNLGIIKFLAAEQTIKNAGTGLPLGGAKSGSDFDPKGKSDNEIMRFCQAVMTEWFKYVGTDIRVPAGDIGTGTREIGYLFGMYKKLTGKHDAGAFTGKGLQWGGSHIRPEATGYGLVYFAEEMLKTKDDFLSNKTCLISGSGNVAQYTAEKLIEKGAKVLTMSDSDGFIYDKDGIDKEKLNFIMELKNVRRGRIEDCVGGVGVEYISVKQWESINGIWTIDADCAFPCATENEIGRHDAEILIESNVKLVAEGANMPCTQAAIKVFKEAGILYGPGKAANAGGVAVSGLEMSQNSMRRAWPREKVDKCLFEIMKHIHAECLEAAAEYGQPGNYEAGANIAGFTKVATAMFKQGVV